MPAKRILDALGMTPSQWGALPPDVGPGATDDRKKLREKATRILAENEGTGETVKARVDSLERRLEAIERIFNTVATNHEHKPKE